ncbi:MAG: dienelactone hydrolase [Gammaproteobacteria bacterium]|nr:dienelactone hydrolase [Gammaproteobacteria bacterium]MDD9894533.1 dienelactone hydrolase [Gammaproteobacteria bacterium]MDD9957625.1 dienelactone hydrolase [Gammaproteobacteria bacterium]
MRRYVVPLMFGLASSIVSAQPNRIDLIDEAAPELAQFGGHSVGVRTLEVVAPNRIDILNTPRGGETAFYERTLTLEIWYPADLQGAQPGTQYQAITRNPEITATLSGRAVRDAEPLRADGPYPLIIISHGYPGNRYLMSHTGENLASKGYVVASIDHAESTYDDQQAFSSTLYNRPLDQRHVLNTLAHLSSQPDGIFSEMINADYTGIVGYSMGGYGLINNLGGGYTEEIISGFMAPPNRLLQEHATSNPDYRSNLDERIRAGFAVAPWGMNAGFWQAEDLAGINVPTFYLAGDQDTVAGYENGPRAIYEAAVNSDRFLLTFLGAGHNAGAPIPVPAELNNADNKDAAAHYRDENWDNVVMNNIMDHYVTAWFDFHLKGIDRSAIISAVPPGFEERLTVEHLSPGQ